MYAVLSTFKYGKRNLLCGLCYCCRPTSVLTNNSNTSTITRVEARCNQRGQSPVHQLIGSDTSGPAVKQSRPVFSQERGKVRAKGLTFLGQTNTTLTQMVNQLFKCFDTNTLDLRKHFFLNSNLKSFLFCWQRRFWQWHHFSPMNRVTLGRQKQFCQHCLTHSKAIQ